MSSNFLHQQPAFTIDPVEEAEAIGGGPLQALSMQLMLSAQRRMLAIDNGDTCFGDNLARFSAIAIRAGFVQIAQYPFNRSPSKYDPEGTPSIEETLTIYRHPQSHAILTIESYRTGESVNCAKLYFVVNPQEATSLKRNEAINRHSFSGCWESLSDPQWRQTFDGKLPQDCVFVGSTDVRECLVSQHQAVLSLNPVARPVDSRFEIEDVFGCSQDYTDFEGMPWPNKVKALKCLRESRMYAFNLDPRDFGYAP